MIVEEVVEVPHEALGVAGARRSARRCLTDWEVPVEHDLVVLLVSESVTNAICHGQPPCSLHLTWDGSTLRIAVSDTQLSALPVRRYANEESESGRGLALVEAIADRWGVTTCDVEKSLWFEIDHA
jgi:anti-sigma regulatory factor (Ser/Thr protein kinase)